MTETNAPAVSPSPLPTASAPDSSVSAPAASPVTTASETAPSSSPAPVETAETPVVAPATETPAADAPAEEQPAGDAPPTEETKVEGEVKPEEAAAEGAEPPKAAAPVYTEFKLPEGATADEPTMSAFKNILAKNNLTQEAGQELVDFHNNIVQQTQKAVEQRQQDAFADTRRGFVQDFEKSAGNRRNTVLNDAKWAITELMPNEKSRKELYSVLAFTGAGDNKYVISLLAAAAKKMREGAAPGPSTPMNGPNNLSPAERRYGARK